MLGTISSACVVLFLVSAMLSIGLDVTITEVLSTLHQRRLLVKALIGNFVLVPLLGVLIAWAFRLPQNVDEGLLLLAAAPGALFAVNFKRQVKGSIPLAAALLFLLTAMSLVLTPPLAGVLLRLEESVSLDYGRAIFEVLVYVALPLLAGIALRRWLPPVAQALERPTTICAGISFVAVAVLTLSIKSAATKKIGWNGLIALCLLIADSIVIGWMSGGPQTDNRRVLVVSTSMRNVALCLAIALKSFPDANVDVPVIAFSSLMLPPNLLFTLYHARKAKRMSAPRERP